MIPTIKDRIKVLNVMYPYTERIVAMDIDIEEDVYEGLDKMASDSDVMMEDLIFMILIEYIEEHM